jgi:hypothetical protein
MPCTICVMCCWPKLLFSTLFSLPINICRFGRLNSRTDTDLMLLHNLRRESGTDSHHRNMHAFQRPVQAWCSAVRVGCPAHPYCIGFTPEKIPLDPSHFKQLHQTVVIISNLDALKVPVIPPSRSHSANSFQIDFMGAEFAETKRSRDSALKSPPAKVTLMRLTSYSLFCHGEGEYDYSLMQLEFEP